MRIPGLNRLRKLVTRKSRGGVFVLCYHRIAEVDIDPWGLCVSPEHFEEQLGVLAGWGPVLPLNELVGKLKTGRLPRRASVITFDDGYADNLHAAKPALERHGMPGTFFLTTGMLGGTTEFWWDELERLLLGAAHLPQPLRLIVADQVFELASPETAPTPRTWRAWEAAPSPRHAFYYELWQRLIEGTDEERNGVLSQLRTLTATDAQARPTHRTMTKNEAIELSRSPLVQIGAHTVTHPALTLISSDRQESEVVNSKLHLEELIGRPVTSFAYPYGRLSDSVVAMLADTAIDCACTTEAAPVRPDTDPLRIPRTQVMDVSGGTFKNELDSWAQFPSA